ncbi:MAG: hypothetical protein ACKV2T_04145 [Kofleriaceae bacterium]
MGGFSFASVILSYFLVAGGTFLATILAARLGIQNEYLGYAIMAVGGAFGGLLAARTSAESTIIEPAMGSLLMVGSLFVLGVALAGKEDRSLLLLPSSLKGLSLTAAASAGGGIAGAFLSEKIFGTASKSSVPWIVYATFAGFGAGVIGTIFGASIGKGEPGPLYGIVAICCMLVGISSGASARTRPLLATLFGGAIGTGGFYFLTIYLLASLFAPGATAASIPSEVYAGIAVVAVGAGIVTMIGALIGWLAAGKKAATGAAA